MGERAGVQQENIKMSTKANAMLSRPHTTREDHKERLYARMPESEQGTVDDVW